MSQTQAAHDCKRRIRPFCRFLCRLSTFGNFLCLRRTGAAAFADQSGRGAIGESRDTSICSQSAARKHERQQTSLRKTAANNLYATWPFKVNHIRRMSTTAPANRMRRRRLPRQRRRFQLCAATDLEFDVKSGIRTMDSTTQTRPPTSCCTS